MKTSTRIKKSIAYIDNAQHHVDYLQREGRKAPKHNWQFNLSEVSRKHKTAIGMLRKQKFKKEDAAGLSEVYRRQNKLIASIRQLKNRWKK